MRTVVNTTRPTTIDTSRPLPLSWRKIAGILRGRRTQLEHHARTVRSEWK